MKNTKLIKKIIPTALLKIREEFLKGTVVSATKNTAVKLIYKNGQRLNIALA